MPIDRRTLLKGGATAGAVAGLTVAPYVGAKEPPLVIYDSRIAESARFAIEHPGDGKYLDISQEETKGWPLLRGGLPRTSTVEGLTGWSDWVAVRGELEAQGWRFHREDRAPSPLSGKAHLFRWSLRARI